MVKQERLIGFFNYKREVAVMRAAAYVIAYISYKKRQSIGAGFFSTGLSGASGKDSQSPV
jgi:hypothetical protein